MIRNSTFKFYRDRTGLALTNVPRIVTVSSPTGYEWGYGGSGPSDLALNLLEYVLRRVGFKGRKITVNGVRIFEKSSLLKSAFKFEVIAKLPIEGGELKLMDILTWIETQK